MAEPMGHTAFPSHCFLARMLPGEQKAPQGGVTQLTPWFSCTRHLVFSRDYHSCAPGVTVSPCSATETGPAESMLPPASSKAEGGAAASHHRCLMVPKSVMWWLDRMGLKSSWAELLQLLLQ